MSVEAFVKGPRADTQVLGQSFNEAQGKAVFEVGQCHRHCPQRSVVPSTSSGNCEYCESMSINDPGWSISPSSGSDPSNGSQVAANHRYMPGSKVAHLYPATCNFSCLRRALFHVRLAEMSLTIPWCVKSQPRPRTWTRVATLLDTWNICQAVTIVRLTVTTGVAGSASFASMPSWTKPSGPYGPTDQIIMNVSSPQIARFRFQWQSSCYARSNPSDPGPKLSEIYISCHDHVQPH